MKKESNFVFSEGSLINDNLNRKKLLFPKDGLDLEQMQEEFKKTDKISVKVIDSKFMSSKQDKSAKKIDSDQTKSKKKKDFITIDNKSDYVPESSNEKLMKINKVMSIFNSEISSNSEISKIEIDHKTGLPLTFKIDNIQDKIKKKMYREKDIKIEAEKKKKQSVFKEKFENEEYKQISEKNSDLIKNLSGEELIRYTQEMKASIPRELIEKMELGYFQKILDKKNLTSMIYSQSGEEVEEENDSESEEEGIEDLVENIKEESFKGKELEKKKDDYLFNYYKKYKKTSNLENIVSSSFEINYQNVNLNNLELSEKYFSMKEIYNFLSSTLDSHINIGMKLLSYIFDLLYSETIEDNLESFLCENIKQKNFFIILVYLIENKNKSIRLKSIEIVILILKSILKEYNMNLKKNVFYYCNFPLINHKEKKYLLNQIHSDEELDFLDNLVDRTQSIFTYVKNDICGISNYLKNYELNILLTFVKRLCITSQKTSHLFYNSELLDKFFSIFTDSLHNNNLSVCKKIISILFYMTFQDINKLRIILEKLYHKIGNLSNDEKILILFNKLEYIHLIYENRYFNQKYFELTVNQYLDTNNSDIIYSKCILKLIHEENMSYFSDLSQKILENHKSKKLIYLKEKSERNLESFINSILIIIKLFRYMQNREEDIKIVDNENDLMFLSDIYKGITNTIKNKLTISVFDQNLNNSFYMLFILLRFFKTAKKYPKLISYMKIKNLGFLKTFDIMYENLFNNYKIMNELKKEEKICFLNRIQNSVEFSFQTLKYLSKYRSENEDILSKNTYSDILYILPSFLNVLEQNNILKFCGILTNYLVFKIEKNSLLKSFYEDTKYDIRSIIEELYLYMGSNEDFRKSKILNEIMYYNEKVSQISVELSDKDMIFLPTEKNYILQILFKDTYDSEAKLKVLFLLVMIFFNDNQCDTSFNEGYDFLIIILKTFYSFKDVIWSNRAETIFNFFISSLVLKRKHKKSFWKKQSNVMSNQDLDLLLEDLRMKYEFPSPNNNSAFFTKLLLIWFATIDNLGINKFNLLFMFNFSIYKDFYDESNMVNESDIVSNIINNKDIIFLDFLENLFVIERKYFLKCKDKEFGKNIIYRLIMILKKIIRVEDDDSIEVVHNKIKEFLTN